MTEIIPLKVMAASTSDGMWTGKITRADDDPAGNFVECISAPMLQFMVFGLAKRCLLQFCKDKKFTIVSCTVEDNDDSGALHELLQKELDELCISVNNN